MMRVMQFICYDWRKHPWTRALPFLPFFSSPPVLLFIIDATIDPDINIVSWCRAEEVNRVEARRSWRVRHPVRVPVSCILPAIAPNIVRVFLGYQRGKLFLHCLLNDKFGFSVAWRIGFIARWFCLGRNICGDIRAASLSTRRERWGRFC